MEKELKTRYATIKYDNEKQLHLLDRKLYLSRELSNQLRKRRTKTIQDEIVAKIDIVMEQVQITLGLFPENLRFELLLFSTAKDAQKELFKRYDRKVNFISFYSRRDNTLYLSARHSELGLVSHELAHVVVEHYFDKSVPVNIHEVLAQHAASRITE